MGNNFEAKHPRAKDGKFTEKHRAESGLTLELESANHPEPESTVSTAGRKIINEHYDGDTLEIRTFRNGSDAGEAVRTCEFYRENGRVWVRRYQDADCKRVRSIKTPYEEKFNYDGGLRSVAYFPTDEQLSDHFASSDEKVVLEQSYDDDGVLRREIYLTYVEGESVIERNTALYDPNGKELSVDWEEYRAL